MAAGRAMPVLQVTRRCTGSCNCRNMAKAVTQSRNHPGAGLDLSRAALIREVLSAAGAGPIDGVPLLCTRCGLGWRCHRRVSSGRDDRRGNGSITQGVGEQCSAFRTSPVLHSSSRGTGCCNRRNMHKTMTRGRNHPGARLNTNSTQSIGEMLATDRTRPVSRIARSGTCWCNRSGTHRRMSKCGNHSARGADRMKSVRIGEQFSTA